MIFLNQPSGEEQETACCPSCGTVATISCIAILDTLEKLKSLLDGDLNTTSCRECGETVTADIPLWVNLQEHGLDPLFYMPFHYLELGPAAMACFEAPESANQTYYSRSEIVRQLQARILIRHLKLEADGARPGGRIAR
jgi:hypothetical protein